MLSIIENNKLIAEFLGRNGKINKSLYTWKGIDALLSGGWVPIEQMKFHSDWNWLMQVVEKIESLHETNNVLIGTNITYVQIHNKVINEQEIFKGVSNIKIEAVYNACVEFIKWYNEQKQK